jgi:hypothetical protein
VKYVDFEFRPVRMLVSPWGWLLYWFDAESIGMTHSTFRMASGHSCAISEAVSIRRLISYFSSLDVCIFSVDDESSVL